MFLSLSLCLLLARPPALSLPPSLSRCAPPTLLEGYVKGRSDGVMERRAHSLTHSASHQERVSNVCFLPLTFDPAGRERESEGGERQDREKEMEGEKEREAGSERVTERQKERWKERKGEREGGREVGEMEEGRQRERERLTLTDSAVQQLLFPVSHFAKFYFPFFFSISWPRTRC